MIGFLMPSTVNVFYCQKNGFVELTFMVKMSVANQLENKNNNTHI